MSVRELLDAIENYTTRDNDQVFNQIKLLYECGSLDLEDIPHNYLSQGYFFDQCYRSGKLDLLPHLVFDEVQNLKNTRDELMKNGCRVSFNELRLKRFKLTDDLVKLWFQQNLTNPILSQRLELNEKEVEHLGESDFKLLNYGNWLYSFSDSPNIDTPLFICIETVDFSNGGLIVLGTAEYDYDLFDFNGNRIASGDYVRLLAEGVVAVYDDDRHVTMFSNYSWVKNMIEYLDTEYHSGILNDISVIELPIKGRDKLKFDDNGLPERVENFNRPLNASQAEDILRNPNTNWICSPELSCFFRNNKKLAILALQRDKLSYTLLTEELKDDLDVQKAAIDYVICKEYKFDLSNWIDDLAFMSELLIEEPVLMELMPSQLLSNKPFMLEFFSSLDGDFDSHIIGFLDDSLLRDEEFAVLILGKNGKCLKHFAEVIRTNKQMIEIAATNESKDDLPF